MGGAYGHSEPYAKGKLGYPPLSTALRDHEGPVGGYSPQPYDRPDLMSRLLW